MSQEQFDKQNIIDHWISASDEDYDTMITLFEAQRYSWALFLGHLVIEKLLKAFFVKIKEDYPPITHNLLKLANDAEIELSEELKVNLTTITAFNLNTRYDDYKRSFTKKCNPEFTNKWINIIKDLRLWIKELIK